jgi:hypothetical protein
MKVDVSDVAVEAGYMTVNILAGNNAQNVRVTFSREGIHGLVSGFGEDV